jgi:hypothetical protein
MVCASVLNGRIYRAAFLPLLFALAIAGFSLTDRPAALTSNLAPYAFEGTRAFAEAQQLAARYPDRAPGGPGDSALAAYVAEQLRNLGGTTGAAFVVQESSSEAQTIDGPRSLRTVLARRAGTSGGSAIVIVAHRDAAAAPARGELAATAVMLGLARVLASSETRRTIVLVSTSGGSGGDGGAADLAAHAATWAGGPVDGAIVLGDLAAGPGDARDALFLGSFANTPGGAPELLQRTVAQALAGQLGRPPRAPTLLARLAQLAFPLPAGEQGPLNAAAVPAVLVQAGGELPSPGAGSPDAAQLEALGRGVLASVYALDAGPDIASAAPATPETSLPVAHKLLPAWAVRLVVLALLAPPLLTAGDGLARWRRRRLLAPGGYAVSFARAVWWVGACGLPFLLCALFVRALGALGAFPAPRPPLVRAALALHGGALLAVLAVLLLFALVWLLWPSALRRLALPVVPDREVGALALLLVLGALAVLVWVVDPFAALLLVPALHLWLGLAAPAPRARRHVLATVAGPLVLAMLGAAPLVLLLAFYAHRFALGLGGFAHTGLLLLASDRVGLAGALLWSVAAGCLAGAALLALGGARAAAAVPPPPPTDPVEPWRESISIRGPLSYAGPGSLGGTESALRH